MSKTLNVYPDKCTSCRLCELACSYKKTGEFSPIYSRIEVNLFHEEAFYIPITCTQCAEAWCLHACPSRALYLDPEKAVVQINEERCVGCRICILACPFGVITYDAVTGKVVKCDYCDGDPECVKFCPTGALAYEEEPKSARFKRIETARKLLNAYKEV